MGRERVDGMRSNCLTETAEGVEIRLRVVPGASVDRIVGVLGDALKIRVAAPPEKGRANAAVLRVLAEALRRPVKDLAVVRGGTSQRKSVLVRGVKLSAVAIALGLDGPR